MTITEDLTRSQLMGVKLECIRLAIGLELSNEGILTTTQEWYDWIIRENPSK